MIIYVIFFFNRVISSNLYGSVMTYTDKSHIILLQGCCVLSQFYFTI